MPGLVQAVAFDSIETLFSLEPLRARFQEVGLPPTLVQPWYVRFLRDGCAMAAMGDFRPMKEVAPAALIGLAAEHGYTVSEASARQVMKGFEQAPAHPDVASAFQRLRAARVKVALLSNGSESVTRNNVEHAGLSELVHAVFSVDAVRLWKPRAEVYRFAAAQLELPARAVALVAVHDWDCRGAQLAGLTTGFVQRKPSPFSPAMGAPDVSGSTLVDVVDRLLAL